MISEKCHRNRGLFFSCLFILFHLVGLIGLLLPSVRTLFLKVIPWHLLLMFILVIANHQSLNKRFLLFITTICMLGFTAECTGVHTDVLFGKYDYGSSLGVKLYGVPLTMCINWFMLIYTTGVTVNKLKINIWIRLFAGAAILVLLDTLIEPVAMRLDYWHWQHNVVPPFNYICWFLLSFIMLYFFELFKFKQQNPAPFILLISQFIFFAALNCGILLYH